MIITKKYCIYKICRKINNSVKAITDNIYEYSNTEEIISIIKKIVESIRE